MDGFEPEELERLRAILGDLALQHGSDRTAAMRIRIPQSSWNAISFGKDPLLWHLRRIASAYNTSLIQVIAWIVGVDLLGQDGEPRPLLDKVDELPISVQIEIHERTGANIAAAYKEAAKARRTVNR